ncbi:hypothetical protein K2173_011456 [Erythroxylum novogranatense]|uniref:Cupin type-1 domain-containing protein n=1 Tax=Erythroxylum novogranatense TaxID=1862640 RepID=A0AAV8TFL3_9ROSI|nr:hypothetical protein K2173_011456 [Erythroxylum novogranatense]
MAKSSLLPLTLCFIVLFQCCSAQLAQVISRLQEEGQKQTRSRQFDQCQLNRLNAAEPSRRIQSEAGVTEIWDENDDQFQCAGVIAIRHRILQRGLVLPAYNNAPKLIYVALGRGIHGAVIPGCPETFQSSQSQSQEQRPSSRDQHQKVRQIREGDILAVPAGVSDWIYNNGQSQLVLVAIVDTSNPANQLDENFRKFFLAGNPQQEIQGQSQSVRGESPRERKQNSGNIFSGFDDRTLAEAFNINPELARRMKNERDDRGIIVRVKGELDIVLPRQSREEEEHERREKDNGIEETFCTARLKQNIDEPSRADVFNPRAGRMTTIDSFNLPILRFLGLSAQKVVLYRNALMTPYWNINAHGIHYFNRGSGRVQVVDHRGQTVFDGEVREGQILVIPQNFVVVKRASEQGLECVSFKTNDQAQISQLAGRVSTIRAIPEEVLSNAFQISREDARRIKYNREEVSLFSPRTPSGPRD